MSASLYTQGGIANPSVQDAYGLISQLNEKKLALVVEYVKQLLKQNDDTVDSAHEDDDLSKKRAAFAKLMEIREKVAESNLPSIDEMLDRVQVRVKWAAKIGSDIDLVSLKMPEF